MRWRAISNKPKTDSEVEVLMARFSEGVLVSITRGVWYSDESAGYFAPFREIKATHWMPYSEYWKSMNELTKE